MKIDGVTNKPVTSKTTKKKKAATAGDLSFFGLLESQLEPPVETAPAEKTKATSESSQASASTRFEGLTLGEQAIDILDSLAEGLGNLELAAEDLGPLVEALEEDMTTILNIKEQLPADDPLAILLDRVAAVAFMETEKFRRGDYK